MGEVGRFETTMVVGDLPSVGIRKSGLMPCSTLTVARTSKGLAPPAAASNEAVRSFFAEANLSELRFFGLQMGERCTREDWWGALKKPNLPKGGS